MPTLMPSAQRAAAFFNSIKGLLMSFALVRFLVRRSRTHVEFPGSEEYWRERYRQGRSSGRGSYGELAEFKANILNQFVKERGVVKVIEYGCGDGNQLRYATYPAYIGFDISQEAIALCREIFRDDPTKSFKLMSEYEQEKADLTLSLDVIYHLVEDDVYASYMERLFDTSSQYVIIYSSNTDRAPGGQAPHVRHREFTAWIRAHRPGWVLVNHIPNLFPFRTGSAQGSFADFYIYQKTEVGLL